MTSEHDQEESLPPISKDELEWAAANMPRMRRWVSGPFFVREALIYAFVFGLLAHVGGYLLTTIAHGEPLRLIADLLATMGTTIWTGAVLYIFVDVLPQTRRRWAERRLAAYESLLKDQGRTNS